MGQKSAWIVALLVCGAPLLAAQPNPLCNQDHSLCVNAAVAQSVIHNPLYFEVEVRSSDPVVLAWDLHDSSGTLLAQDSTGDLAFLLRKSSSTDRTLAVRDFALAPAKSTHGTLLLHPTAFNAAGDHLPLPQLSIPVQLDLRTTTVTYAVAADPDAFSQALDAAAESDPAHPIPMQAQIEWRTNTVLYTPPALLGGAAAEAAALADAGQGPWHLANYRQSKDTAHITIFGQGWAGVSYYLTGLDYLLQKTAEHQPGIRRVVFDSSPGPGQ